MMKYIKDTLDFKIEEPSVITLGKFDGLHTGHRYLMDAMQKGKEQGLKCVIFTFDIPPKAIHKDTYSVLSTNEEKHIFLRKLEWIIWLSVRLRTSSDSFHHMHFCRC